MRYLTTLAAMLILASPVTSESLRGPLAAELAVTPLESAAAELGLEGIVLITIEGDVRFLDAIDIELTSPATVGEHPGALVFSILGPVGIDARSGILSVVGPEVLRRPLVRGGKTFYQVVLHEGADPASPPAATRIEHVVSPSMFPIALTVVSRMKGLSPAMQQSVFTISARPVAREVGSMRVRYIHEDGSHYDPDGGRDPEFSLSLDERPIEIDDEYLVEPGLHRLRLRSERYQDQDLTVGVDRGREVSVEMPLQLALATVSYIAPSEGSVYINGQLQEGTTGDFTVPPGEHTIVVVVGDHTVTRRFRVEERRSYSISVTMDIAIEEIK